MVLEKCDITTTTTSTKIMNQTARTRDACTIFIRNISPSLTRLEVEQYFSEVGPVKKCSLISESKPQKDQHHQGQGDSSTKKQRYGFVKFCNEYDASRAVLEHNASQINSNSSNNDDSSSNELFRAMIVEHADSSANSSRKKSDKVGGLEKSPAEQQTRPLSSDQIAVKQKQTARVIIRNLSFYATETHVRKTMSEFGTVVEVHLPLVPIVPSSDNNNNNNHNSSREGKQHSQHRGFAFVTFENSVQAQKAVSSENPTIKNRPVTIELSISKQHHQQQQKQHHQDHKNRNLLKEESMDHDKHSLHHSSTTSTTSNSDHDDSQSDIDDASIDSSKSSVLEDEESVEKDVTVKEQDEAGKTNARDDETETAKESNFDDVQEQRTLFIRNIPFDTDRHSLFLLFKQFGKIEGIFLVKDNVTKVCKGTAFIKFQTKEACARALTKAGRAREDAPFIISQAGEQQEEDGGIFFQGRRLLVDLALDKDQASTLVAERDPETGQVLKKQMGKDRRNLYLKQEGHIPTNTLLWDSLPTVDQEKRQRASSEKSTKLKSPIFFINPLRLSVRNLGKHVTKSGLKSLAGLCTQEGLRKGLVTTMDVTAHLRAQGTLTPRECLSEEFCSVPPFDPKNVKKYIPSVFVNTNAENGKSTKSLKKGEPISSIASSTSKGFGFIEFTYHAHALACLRELNNNAKYSAEWAFRGSKSATINKRRSDNKADSDALNDAKKVSRIIVEFAIENKLKAKQQADRRARLLSLSGSREQDQGATAEEEATCMKKKKKGRGSAMREKKRKRKEGESEIEAENKDDGNTGAVKNKLRGIPSGQKDENVRSAQIVKKTQKKRKIDKEESLLDQILTKHQTITPAMGTPEGNGKKSSTGTVAVEKMMTKKRWFE